MIQGDYDRRMRGLEALFRPEDLVEYDVLVRQMAAGRATGEAGGMSTPYTILRAYCEQQGVSVGEPCTGWVAGHCMGYLASALLIQHGRCGRWPILVVSAYEEFLNEQVPKVFLDPHSSGATGRTRRRRTGPPGHLRTPEAGVHTL